MKLADLSLAGIAVELDQDGNLLIEAPQGALTPELISRIGEAKPRLVAELRAGREHCELGELQGYLGGLETEIVTPTFKVHAPPPQTPEALRTALAEAGKGLPVTVAELVREFGAEGREGWEAGDYAHPAFLRAFAKAVAERLERERCIESKPAGHREAGAGTSDVEDF